jgi:hypothetical protein
MSVQSLWLPVSKKKACGCLFRKKKSLWLPASCNFGPELYCLMQIQMRKVVDEVN